MMRARDAVVVALASSLVSAGLAVGAVRIRHDAGHRETAAVPIADIDSRKELLEEIQTRAKEKERIAALSDENRLSLGLLTERLNALAAESSGTVSP